MDVGVLPCRFLEVFGPNLVEKMHNLCAGAQAPDTTTSSTSGTLSFLSSSVVSRRPFVDLSSTSVTTVDVTGSPDAERVKAAAREREEQRKAKREQDQRNLLIGLAAAAAAIWATWAAGSYIQKSNDAFIKANEADILLRSQHPYGIDLSSENDQKAAQACGKVFQQFRDFYTQKSWSAKVLGGFALAIAAEATAVAISAFYKYFSVRNIGIVALGLTALSAIFTYAVSSKAQLSPKLFAEIDAIEAAVNKSRLRLSEQNPAPPSYETVRQADYNEQLSRNGFAPLRSEGGLEWTHHNTTKQMFWRFSGSTEWNFAGYLA